MAAVIEAVRREHQVLIPGTNSGQVADTLADLAGLSDNRVIKKFRLQENPDVTYKQRDVYAVIPPDTLRSVGPHDLSLGDALILVRRDLCVHGHEGYGLSLKPSDLYTVTVDDRRIPEDFIARLGEAVGARKRSSIPAQFLEAFVSATSKFGLR